MPKSKVVRPPVLVRIKNSCLSFFKKNFNTNSLNLAIFFALPVYINFVLMKYGVSESFLTEIIFTADLFFTLHYLFNSDHKPFGSGFFIGVFLFWWIGLSFRYYGLDYMIVFVILLIGIVYGLLFFIIFKIISFHKYLGKIFAVLFFTYGFDYVSFFTFDWLKPEILFVNTFYSVDKTAMLLVFIAAFYKELKIFSLILLISALFFKNGYVTAPKLDIYPVSTYVSQEKKWDGKYIPLQIEKNISLIRKAILLKKDVIVLPESAFALFLNRNEKLMRRLKKLSEKIVIITGALHYKNGKFYNSAYVFDKGNVKIIDKHILVPFGEYIPIPFFQKEINKIFFNGASDYSVSKRFGRFSVKGYDFLSAICYEATVEKLYTLNPPLITALSNDAWFMPSIMPSLQYMLIKTYAYRHKKIVYHSINGFKSYTVANFRRD